MLPPSMITSPGDSSGSRCSMNSSTAGPALTISITLRGAARLATSSSSVWQPTKCLPLAAAVHEVVDHARRAVEHGHASSRGSRCSAPGSRPSRPGRSGRNRIYQAWFLIPDFRFDCSLLPRRLVWQVTVELGQQFHLIFAGERADEESVETLVQQPPPTRFLRAGIDRGRTAHRSPRPPCDRPARRRSSACGRADSSCAACKHSFFVPISWPQMATTYLARSCSSHSRLRASFGVAETTNTSACDRSFSRQSRTKGTAGTSRTISSTARFTALDHSSKCRKSRSPVSWTAFSSDGLPSFGSRATHSRTRSRHFDLHAAGVHFRPRGSPVKLLDQGRKAVDAPALGIKIDEVRTLRGRTCSRLPARNS